ILVWVVAKHWKIPFTWDALLTIMICVIVGIIVGARLGYVIFYGNGYYFSHPLEIFAVNEGGMSFHGGLAGALIGGIVATKITGV
ncbi:MAG: prolipoprotein diacylglyceryl transferase, partial [Eggerthellaceae bacterium]|nr:prolipoprotein diacylglyceryl transferase [Eggerthellaceae bacterium]